MKHFIFACCVFATISITQAQSPRKAIISGDLLSFLEDTDKRGFYALVHKRDIDDADYTQQAAEFEIRKINLEEYYREDKTVDYEKIKRDSIRYFLRGFSFPQKKIQGVLLNGKTLFPGESMMVLGHHFYATGNVVRSTDTTSIEVFSEIKNYSLGVRTKRDNKITDQRMLAMDLERWVPGRYLGGYFFMWAGDLDDDGELDIILNATAHHECFSILLISFTKKGKVYIKHREDVCAG